MKKSLKNKNKEPDFCEGLEDTLKALRKYWKTPAEQQVLDEIRGIDISKIFEKECIKCAKCSLAAMLEKMKTNLNQ